jgi:hypothetical protein
LFYSTGTIVRGMVVGDTVGVTPEKLRALSILKHKCAIFQVFERDKSHIQKGEIQPLYSQKVKSSKEKKVSFFV